jgi:hypothetical protein
MNRRLGKRDADLRMPCTEGPSRRHTTPERSMIMSIPKNEIHVRSSGSNAGSTICTLTAATSTKRPVPPDPLNAGAVAPVHRRPQPVPAWLLADQPSAVTSDDVAAWRLVRRQGPCRAVPIRTSSQAGQYVTCMSFGRLEWQNKSTPAR